jgi:hypothetical protein
VSVSVVAHNTLKTIDILLNTTKPYCDEPANCS